MNHILQNHIIRDTPQKMILLCCKFGTYIYIYIYSFLRLCSSEDQGVGFSRIPMDGSDGSCKKIGVVCRKSFGFGQVAGRSKRRRKRTKIIDSVPTGIPWDPWDDLYMKNLHEWLIFMVNVGKWTIHGSSRVWNEVGAVIFLQKIIESPIIRLDYPSKKDHISPF